MFTKRPFKTALFITLVCLRIVCFSQPGGIGNNLFLSASTYTGSDIQIGIDYDYDWGTRGDNCRLFSIHSVGIGTPHTFNNKKTALGLRIREAYGIQAQKEIAWKNMKLSAGYLPLDVQLSTAFIFFGSSATLGLHFDKFSLQYEKSGFGFFTGFIYSSWTRQRMPSFHTFDIRYGIFKRMNAEVKIMRMPLAFTEVGINRNLISGGVSWVFR
jgi:hypothetical protein